MISAHPTCAKIESPAETSDPVRGLITAVRENAIEVQEASGRNWSFAISKNLEVPLEHLKEHMKEKWPVSVYYQIEKGKNIAIKIAD